MSEKKKELNPWIATIAAILVGIAMVSSKQKVSATTTLLVSQLGLTMGDCGYMTSVLTVFGVVLAIPAGAIMMKTGAKKLVLASIVAELVGNLVGCFASSYEILMVGRFIEGLAFGLLPVAAPAIIANSFAPEKRGLPMAIWSCYNGLGLLIMSTVVPFLLPDGSTNWVSCWWFNVVFFALLFILVLCVVHDPEPNRAEKGEGSVKPETAKGPSKYGKDFVKALLSPTTWLVSLAMMIFCIGVNALCAFSPAYAQKVLGMTLVDANLAFSWFSIGNLVGGLVIGVVLNKMKNKHIWLIIGTVAILIGCAFMYNFTVEIAPMFFFIAGTLFQIYPAAAFTVCPDTAYSPATLGVALGVLTIMQRLGTYFTGPIGSVIDGGGFSAGTTLCVAASAIGVALSVGAYILLRRKAKKAAATQAVSE